MTCLDKITTIVCTILTWMMFIHRRLDDSKEFSLLIVFSDGLERVSKLISVCSIKRCKNEIEIARSPFVADSVSQLEWAIGGIIESKGIGQSNGCASTNRSQMNASNSTCHNPSWLLSMDKLQYRNSPSPSIKILRNNGHSMLIEYNGDDHMLFGPKGFRLTPSIQMRQRRQ